MTIDSALLVVMTENGITKQTRSAAKAFLKSELHPVEWALLSAFLSQMHGAEGRS